MSLVRVAFATCPPHAPFLDRLAARFAAVADIRAFPSRVTEVERVLPALADAAPHVVVADPQLVPCLSGCLRAPIVPFECGPDDVVPLVEAAAEHADSIAVVLPEGSIGSPLARALRRRAGAGVHVLTWKTQAEIPDLIARARRLEVRAVVGGVTASRVARQEGLLGLCLYDRDEISAGALTRLAAAAIARVLPRLVARRETLAALEIVLEKIVQRAIEPRDAVLCLDQQGRVLAAYGSPGHEGRESIWPSLAAAGVPLVRALSASARARASDGGDGHPVRIELYPLAGPGGYLTVVRDEASRPAPAAGGCPGPDAGAKRADALVRRVGVIADRMNGLARARHGDAAPRRFVGSLRRRTFLLDWERVRYLELRSGLVHAAMADGDTYVTSYTLADILERVDALGFFPVRHHVVVNLNYVAEIERLGRGRLRVVLEGPDSPAFAVSRRTAAALCKLLKC